MAATKRIGMNSLVVEVQEARARHIEVNEETLTVELAALLATALVSDRIAPALLRR